MASRRGGFTLIELLAAMVIGSVVVAAVFQLLGALGRFMDAQGAQIEVRQTATAALELMAAEMRSILPEGGLVKASEDSVTFRSGRLSGAVCDVPGTAALNLIVPEHGATAVTVNSGTAVAVRDVVGEDTVWTVHPVVSIGGASRDCEGVELPEGLESRWIGVAGSVEGAERGEIAFVFDLISYRRGRSAGVSGEWIQRRVGNGPGSSNQPMAGPVESLRFGYSTGTSSPFAPAVDDLAERDEVIRVLVAVEAVSRSAIGGRRETFEDTILVTLRNR